MEADAGIEPASKGVRSTFAHPQAVGHVHNMGVVHTSVNIEKWTPPWDSNPHLITFGGWVTFHCRDGDVLGNH